MGDCKSPYPSILSKNPKILINTHHPAFSDLTSVIKNPIISKGDPKLIRSPNPTLLTSFLSSGSLAVRAGWPILHFCFHPILLQCWDAFVSEIAETPTTDKSLLGLWCWSIRRRDEEKCKILPSCSQATMSPSTPSFFRAIQQAARSKCQLDCFPRPSHATWVPGYTSARELERYLGPVPSPTHASKSSLEAKSHL